MPELPEVETTRRGLAAKLLNQTLLQVIIRQPKLRWSITPELQVDILDQSINAIERRGKFLLFRTDKGTMLIHLGMSGHLRVIESATPPSKHDHVDFIFANGLCLRYNDPRRFGCVLWTTEDPLQHKLLVNLGAEPLTAKLSGNFLHHSAQGRKTTIKQFIMDSSIVVGVGNIYATEALFCAGIAPRRQAGKVSAEKMQELSECIKKILKQAIQAGGTSLKDFYTTEGKLGYFKQKLNVYGKEGQPCPRCKSELKKLIIGQRSTVYCSLCQK